MFVMADIDVKWPNENETETENTTPAATTATAVAEPPAAEAPAFEAPVSDAAPAPENEAAPISNDNEPPKVTPAPSVVTGGGRHPAAMLRLIGEVVLVLLVLGLGLWVLSLKSDNADLKKQVTALNNNPLLVEQRAEQQLVSDVSKLMVLPTNETPTVKKISDIDALKKQAPFFNEAQNGDEILFYPNNGLVIVYRPGTNKIVKSGPLNISNTTTPAASTSTTKTKR
jgi:hypothetical protein